ncbi:MAG TPA: lysophospholipid acyltransferase family protein [Ignavibacteriaceae bacterium]|nr:lysophospholipid acyltransferase family protein [Ignavibacteriaceae bacterium]
MKNTLEYILFISLSYFFRIIGLNLSRKFSSLIAFFFYYILPIRKDVVFDNLKHAFPDFSEDRIKEIAYGSYKSFCLTLAEILYMPWLDEDQLKQIMICEKRDLIVKRFDEGNGVILLSAHLGNWEYLATSVAAQINKKFYVVVKPQRNPFVNNWLNKYRTKWTNEVVPLGVSIRNVFSVLLNKGIVAMVADQRGPEESIKLKFFGRLTSVYTGPAVLSLKTNSPIIYGIAERQKDLNYKVELIEVDRNNLPENSDEKIKVLTERMLKILEDIIRQYPEQWLWMHKRWKH